VLAQVPELWEVVAREHGQQTAVIDTHHHPATELTYGELHDAICAMGRGLQRLGLGCVRCAHMHASPHCCGCSGTLFSHRKAEGCPHTWCAFPLLSHTLLPQKALLTQISFDCVPNTLTDAEEDG